jgi:hypothetical protein
VRFARDQMIVDGYDSIARPKTGTVSRAVRVDVTDVLKIRQKLKSRQRHLR